MNPARATAVVPPLPTRGTPLSVLQREELALK